MNSIIFAEGFLEDPIWQDQVALRLLIFLHLKVEIQAKRKSPVKGLYASSIRNLCNDLSYMEGRKRLVYSTQSVQCAIDVLKDIKFISIIKGKDCLVFELEMNGINTEISKYLNKPETLESSQKHNYETEDFEMARFIFDHLQPQNKGKEFPSQKAWANTIRKMRTIDKRTLNEIKALFLLANKDEFWGTNILSPLKLRKHWDSLSFKLKGIKQKPEKIEVNYSEIIKKAIMENKVLILWSRNERYNGNDLKIRMDKDRKVRLLTSNEDWFDFEDFHIEAE